MDLASIIQKEKSENCGEDEIKCMNQCPNVVSMILSATFNSDSRTSNFDDENNNLFILISNKRFNHGYDRYEIKIYEKTLFNLLFVKNIDKIYSFIGYHQLDQVFYFYTQEDVSQDLVQNRYIDLYEAKQNQDNIMCQEKFLKDLDNDKSECKQQQQFRVTKFYQYSYKNDEMKMINFIPEQYDVNQKQYVCEANIKANKLYCYLQADYQYYVFGYQNVENRINQPQPYVTYYMYTYKFNKNEGLDEIDSLCAYLLNANKFNQDIDKNKKYLFSIKSQNYNPDVDLQQQIEFVAAEIDERDNFMIVFVFSLNESMQNIYKIKVVDLYMGQVQTLNIIYECPQSTIILLKWVEYKKNIYLQNECQSIVINILNNSFYILLSKLHSSSQPNISYNQNTKQIYVYSKMDSLRSKFQIIDVITRQSKIIIQTNNYSIEAMYISNQQHQDLIIFSGQHWEHQFLSSNQSAKYISSGYKQVFNVYKNTSYSYSSSKKFDKTIVVHLVSNSSLNYFDLEQNQENQTAQFLSIFYFLVQKRHINFIVEQDNVQDPQVDQIGKHFLKQNPIIQKYDNLEDKQTDDFSFIDEIEEFENLMEPRVPNQFIIFSDEPTGKKYSDDDKDDKNQFIEFEDISGGGQGKGKTPIKPDIKSFKDINRFFKSYYVEVTQELQECINQIHKDQIYFYDELYRVIVFYFSHLCVIDVTAQTLTLKKQLSNERKIFYHNLTNSVYIVNLNVKSSILYEKISLPDQVFQHKDEQYKQYQAINAYIEQNFLVITLVYLNDKYIFIQNLSDPSQISFKIENYFLNPCSISAGSYRHEYLKNRPLLCYKYEQNDYFHDLIDFNLVQVQSNKLHILFIFTYKVELQEFFYDVYQSTFVQIYSRILFTNEITDILEASFNFHTFQFIILARSEQNLYIYEIPVEKNYSKKDHIESKTQKYYNSYGNINNDKQVTCKIDSIYLDSGVESSVEQFKKFYRMIQFVQSIVYPPQFTLLIKLLIYKNRVPLKDIALPSFGPQQKASIIIKQENIFLPTSNFYTDEEVYFEFDSLFFENLMPLQKLKIEKIEIINSQSPSHITINKIRTIQLTDIFLCQKQKKISDFSIKFQDIDELIITDLKIFDCGEVTINNIRIEGNIIEYINGDIDSYSSTQHLSNEENIEKMKKGQDIFCFLANKQLYQGGLEIINNELFQNMYLMVVYQVLLHSIVLSNIEGNNYLISILLIQNSNTFISDATIINNVGSNRAVVSIEKQTKVEFINSIFQNNKCSLCQGSGLNSIYKNNTSDHGGSISIQNCNQRILFSSIDFIDNNANYGGALSIVQSENIQLNNITFQGNSALIGGAIYYQGFYPRGFFEMDSQLMFINNKATSLGQNIGSFPQSLRLVKVYENIINGRFLEEQRNLNFSTKIDAQQQILINTKNATFGNNKSIYDRMNRDYDKIIFVQNVTSGATLTFQFEIYDEEGNRFYGYKSNIRREIQPVVQTVSTNIVLISSNIRLEDGILFLELEVVGNNQVPLNIEDDYIIVQYQNIFISEKKHESYIELFKQYIYLNFRPCGLGEVYVVYQSQINRKLPLTSVYKCEVCKLGKYSLVAQPTTQTQCQTSTSNAVKQSYGFIIELNQGYWRSSMMSDNFLKCDLKENCNGGESTETSQICHMGHIGPLCEACDIQGIVWKYKFAHSGNHSCTPCNSVTKNTIKILFFILTTFILIVLVLKSTLKYCINKIFLKCLAKTGMLIMGCSANKKVTSVYVKILMSYVQVLESVRYFGINFIEIFLKGINYVASPLEQVSFSGECFMADIGIDMPLVYFKILFALVTPFVFLFIVLVFYYCLYKLKYIEENIKNYYSLTSIFYIILLFQNKIVNMLVEVFNRREIDGEVYMKVNLQYRFYDDQHEKYFKYMIFPSLVFWTLGVILSILIILLKNRKNLQKFQSLFMFGFLYGEYKEDCFYWELLRIFTRIGISISCNFYHQIPKVSCMLMFLVLVIYLIILYFKKPFIQRQLNNLELLSTLICMMTVSLTVLIYSQEQYSQQQQKEKTSTLQFICQAIIVIVNVFFLVYLSFKILLSFIIRWEVRIYKIFGRCLGKKKTNDMLVLKRWSRLRHKVVNNFIQNRQQSKKYYKQNLIYSFDYQNDLQRFVHFCSYDLNHLHNFYHANIPSLTSINLAQKEDSKQQNNNELKLYQSEQIIKRNSISEHLDQLIWSDFLVNHSQKNHPPLFLKKYNSSFQSLDDTNEIAQYYHDLDPNQSQLIFNFTQSSRSYIPPSYNVINFQQNQNSKENIRSEDSTIIEDNNNKNNLNEEPSIILSKTVFIELQKEDKQQKS